MFVFLVDIAQNGTTTNHKVATAEFVTPIGVMLKAQPQPRVMTIAPGPESRTSAPMTYNYIKYGLIVLAVAIPLILLPILFLFARGGNSGDENNPRTPSQDVEQTETQDQLKSLLRPVTFLSTMPERDSILVDGASNSNGSVYGQIVLRGVDQHYYFLSPDNALFRGSTGQFYHPASGLLFNPISNCRFDPQRRLVLNTENNTGQPPNSSLVFDQDTRLLYERCLSVGFKDDVKW